MTPTIEDIRKEIRRLDGRLSVASREFMASAVLLSMLQVGIGPRKLARFTGYSSEQILPIIRNCKRGGLIANGRLRRGDWFGDDGSGNGALYFWLDANVALGRIKKGRQPS